MARRVREHEENRLENKDKGGSRPDRRAWSRTWRTTSIGIEVALCIVAGFLGGRWLDGKFETYPWLTLIGFAAGAVAAGRALWRVVKAEMQDRDGKGK